MRKVRLQVQRPWISELSADELARLSPEQRSRLRALSAQWPGADDGCRGGWWRVPDRELAEICALLDVVGGAA